MATPTPEAGWYPDPDGSGRKRWWDGQAWTDRHLKRVPSQKAELRVGRRAKVVAAGDDHYGQTGTVDALLNEDDDIDVCLRFDGDPDVYGFRRDEVMAVAHTESDASAGDEPAPVDSRPEPETTVETAQYQPPVSSPPGLGVLPADWYDDPDGSGGQRWWDGQSWTPETRQRGSARIPDVAATPAVDTGEATVRSSSGGAGWYPDPDGPGGHRWWDGRRWTTHWQPMPNSAHPTGIPPHHRPHGVVDEEPVQQPAPAAPPALTPTGPPGRSAASESGTVPGSPWQRPGDTRTPPSGLHGWLQSIRDTGAGHVVRGSSRWVSGVAIIAAGVVLLLSTFMAWGHTVSAGFRISLSGLGFVSVTAPEGDEQVAAFITRQLQDEVSSAAHNPGVWALVVALIVVVAGAAYLWTKWRSQAALTVAVTSAIEFLVCVSNAASVGAMMGYAASRGEDYAIGFGLLLACGVTLVLTGLGITAFVFERVSIGSRSRGQSR